MMNKGILVVITAIFLLSCSRKQEQAVSEAEVRATEEALVGANRLLVQRDKEKIREYLEQHHLTLEETSSGLWYVVTDEGRRN